MTEGWESGTTSGFPVLSIKGKAWHIRRGKDVELVTRPDDPDEAALSLNIVVLKANQGVSKTFYKKSYEDGDDNQPDCASADGVAPIEGVPDRQAKKCAICPNNQWGSRITDSGAKAKKCSDNKRLAVAAAGQLNDPLLLRVPPTSLKAWDNYTRQLSKRGLNPTMVVTKVGFDASVAHQLLTFKAVDYVDEESFAELEEALQDPMLDKMVNSAGHSETIPTTDITDEDDDDDLPPPPAAEEEEEAPKPKPKRKPKPKPEPEPEPEEDEEEETDDDDDDDLGDLDIDDLDFGDD
jgi:hypothetical protein